MSAEPRRILIIGAAGFFGRRLVQGLARHEGLLLLLAGRDAQRAKDVAERLRPRARAGLEVLALDAQAPGLATALAAAAPQVVVNASGPFQGQDHRVAEACIACGAHYLDLADGREFVTGIVRLDSAARAAGVLVTSGASSVPALSGAVIDALAVGLARLQAIDIGISPGNRTERGLSTMQAVLSYCGRPLPGCQPDGRPAIGWRGRWRHDYPAPVGTRLLSPCDVPDLALWPARYPGRPMVSFGAGLELGFLHRGMNVMAWLAQRGLVADWSRHARGLKVLANAFKTWGSDAGAMHVRVQGEEASGRPVSRLWTLVATQGDGPHVPTLAAAALVRALTAGTVTARGAMPCVGLLTLADLAEQARGLHIHWTDP